MTVEAGWRRRVLARDTCCTSRLPTWSASSGLPAVGRGWSHVGSLTRDSLNDQRSQAIRNTGCNNIGNALGYGTNILDGENTGLAITVPSTHLPLV